MDALRGAEEPSGVPPIHVNCFKFNSDFKIPKLLRTATANNNKTDENSVGSAACPAGTSAGPICLPYNTNALNASTPLKGNWAQSSSERKLQRSGGCFEAADGH